MGRVRGLKGEGCDLGVIGSIDHRLRLRILYAGWCSYGNI